MRSRLDARRSVSAEFLPAPHNTIVETVGTSTSRTPPRTHRFQRRMYSPMRRRMFSCAALAFSPANSTRTCGRVIGNEATPNRPDKLHLRPVFDSIQETDPSGLEPGLMNRRTR
jgi:hypothetical protein